MEIPNSVKIQLPRLAAIKLVLTVVAFWFFAAWSIGALPTTAFGEGFARAEDAAYNTKLILERELLTTKLSQCRAKSTEASSFWTQKLIDLKADYLERLGRQYDEPTCSVLVVE